MKAVVFKVNKKYAVVSVQGGDFVRIKNAGYAVGQEIELPEKGQAESRVKLAKPLFSRGNAWKWASAAVAVAVIAFVSVFGGLFIDGSLTAAYAVRIDINPSLTFFVNKKDEVIKTEANNGDALLYDLSALKGKKIDESAAAYFSILSNAGVLTETEVSEVKITVTAKRKSMNAAALSDSMKAAAENAAAQLGVKITVSTEAVQNEGYYTVSLMKYNEKEGNGHLFKTIKVKHGKKINMPDKSKWPQPGIEGWETSYWSLDPLGASGDFFASDYTLTGDLTLWAIFGRTDGSAPPPGQNDGENEPKKEP
jgi:hypothetical protein